MSSQREARKQRNREDFLRATRQGLINAGHTKSDTLQRAGLNAGNSLHDHLEDQMKKAVRMYRKAQQGVRDITNKLGPYVPLWEDSDYRKAAQREQTARGMVRGLATALLAHENSYALGDIDALKAIEKEFLNG